MSKYSRCVLAFLCGVCTAIGLTAYSQDNQNIQDDQMHFFLQAIKLNDAEKEAKQMKELSVVPDVIRCVQMTWIRDCETLNNYYKKHPTAYIRILDTEGFEHTFRPGTPATMISLQLAPSDASARAHMAEFDRQGRAIRAAHEFGTKEHLRRGGIRSFSDSYSPRSPIHLPESELSVYGFFDGDEDNDAYVSQLLRLKKRNPQLKITAYLAKGKNANFSDDLKVQGINAKILGEKSRAGISKKVMSYPTIWIDHVNDDDKKMRNILTEGFAAESIEKAAIGLSLKNEVISEHN